MDTELILLQLKKSKFRASFHLKKEDIEYINKKGWQVIESHCYDFIAKRLAPAVIKNDGKQTPTRGHPVFIAQHACACCCRGCLNKWYKISKGTNLSVNDINLIVEVLLAWLHKEYDNFKDIKKEEKVKQLLLTF